MVAAEPLGEKMRYLTADWAVMRSIMLRFGGFQRNYVHKDDIFLVIISRVGYSRRPNGFTARFAHTIIRSLG